ncbi:MAG: hypothetical protein EOP48_00965 [Sphingobacteriales bacterium]|nr:MAG: hypothetical protein EOP48_00965 [Sphingobacteriales bacterium]
MANAAPVFVIAAKNSPASELSREQVARIYLGIPVFIESTKLSGIDYPDETEMHEKFRETILRKNAVQLKQYWTRLIFSGKAKPPEDLSDEKEMVATVRKYPHVIGYVYNKSLTAQVKVIGVFEL